MGGGQFTTTTSAQLAIPGNARRKSLTISNDDSTNVIYIMAAAANPNPITTGTATGRIGPGLTGAFTLNDDGPLVTQSPFWVIATAGTPKGFWIEGLI